MMDEITPDEIREKAIEIVRKNPAGIRQNSLILELVNSLYERLSMLPDPKGKVKNAVWNLDTKTNEVTKQSVGPREVMFFPTTLKQQLSWIMSEPREIYGTYSNKYMPTIADTAQGRLIQTWYLLTEIERTLSDHSERVKQLSEFSPAELATIDSVYIDSIYEMRHAIEALKRARLLISKGDTKS
jgi:hypothetical protein